MECCAVLPELSLEEVLAYFESIGAPLVFEVPISRKRCWVPEPESDASQPKRRCNSGAGVPAAKSAVSEPRPATGVVMRRPRLPKLGYLQVRELLGSMAARLEASHEDGQEGLEPKEMLPLRNRALIHATQQWCLRKYKTALQREEAVLGRLRK